MSKKYYKKYIPFKTILTQLTLIFLSIITLYPVLWVFKMAFSPTQGFSTSLKGNYTLNNFITLFTITDSENNLLMIRQFWNSIFVSVISAFIGLVLATSAAYAFSRFEFKGKKSGMSAMLITQMFPGVLVIIPLYLILDNIGLLNSLWGLILVYSTTTVPFSIFMLKGYFDTIPKEIEEAAVMDGASQFTIFIKIILPLSRPALAITGLFSFMTAWNEFILAATFMGKEKYYTVPVMLQSFVGAFNTQWGLFAAGSIIVSLPVVILFLYVQKHLVGGLTAGGIKG